MWPVGVEQKPARQHVRQRINQRVQYAPSPRRVRDDLLHRDVARADLRQRQSIQGADVLALRGNVGGPRADVASVRQQVDQRAVARAGLGKHRPRFEVRQQRHHTRIGAGVFVFRNAGEVAALAHGGIMPE